MKRIHNNFSLSPDESMRQFRKNNDIALLARKTGSSHNILLDRLNPERDQKLGYLEAVGHSHLTGDHILLKSWANELGYGLFKIPNSPSEDENILNVFLSFQKIQGVFAGTLHQAREDNVIDHVEKEKLGNIINSMINELATLKAEINNESNSPREIV